MKYIKNYNAFKELNESERSDSIKKISNINTKNNIIEHLIDLYCFPSASATNLWNK
jgi:hypothetical protein